MKRRGNLLLLALLVVCALSFWLARSSDPDPAGPETVPGTQSPGDAATPGGSGWVGEGVAQTIHLAVLNGTARPGLARSVGLALATFGCVAQRVGNAPGDSFARTLLINRRLSRRAAASLANRLGGLPVLCEQDSRVTEDAVLVLGADWPEICRALGLSLAPSPAG